MDLMSVENQPSATVSSAELYQAALDHFRAGRHHDAEFCCRRALAHDSEHADAHHLLGILALHAGQYDQAVDFISRAIRHEPRHDYLRSLGTTLLKQGRHTEALQVFGRSVQLNPDMAEAWRNLGNALVAVGRRADAIPCFREAVKRDAGDWDAANKAAVLLFEAGQFEDALVYFTLCYNLQPDHFPTLYMCARTLHNLKRFTEALAHNERLLALDPDNADVCHNTGSILRMLGRDADALMWFDRSLALRADAATTLAEKAIVLMALHRFDEARAAFQRALALDPNHVVAEWNLALLQLLLGDFAAGWAGREVRWKIPAFSHIYPSFSQPMWLSEGDIAGQTIVVCAEEGFGDTLQFARYVPMLAARGARVILMVQDALYSLLSGMAGAAQCLPRSTPQLPAFDLHCPISSLPLAFGTILETIPATTPYLPMPAGDRTRAWEERLGAHDRLRVGLVWSGNPNHGNDHNRSIPFQTLARILDVDATFISLQKDARAEDRARLAHTGIIDLTAHLTDFAETAALISCLDLVISVDTSVAHLAAGLARPTWILLPYTPDYRWLLDRCDSPWYPSVRLFRQDAARDYASVVEKVREELDTLCRMGHPGEGRDNDVCGERSSAT
jgi:tetratricopeptide (TPR) repeat protein